MNIKGDGKMYLGFNLGTKADYTNWYDKGKKMYHDKAFEINKSLKSYLHEGTETINGNLVEHDWFPKLNADVFLSHSHADEKMLLDLQDGYKKILDCPYLLILVCGAIQMTF